MLFLVRKGSKGKVNKKYFLKKLSVSCMKNAKLKMFIFEDIVSHLHPVQLQKPE